MNNIKYIAIVKSNPEELISKIKSNTDNGFINVLFGTKNIYSKIKSNNEIILIRKTRRSIKKDFHCNLKQAKNGIVIYGEFKFNLFTKMIFYLSIILIILTINITITSDLIIEGQNDKMMFIGVLVILVLFELIIFYLREFIVRNDIFIIKKFLNEIVGAEEINEILVHDLLNNEKNNYV